MTRSELHTITAGNGRPLTATFFFPGNEARAAVLIVPAMGVSQKFYSKLASWLSAQGFLSPRWNRYCDTTTIPPGRKIDEKD